MSNSQVACIIVGIIVCAAIWFWHTVIRRYQPKWNRAKLMALLGLYDIPFFEKWGKNSAKTFEHLLKELESGEADLVEENGRLVWKAEVVGALVCYGSCRLREDRQVFKDNRVRHRTNTNSIGEKMKPHESPDQAIRRAVREELGIEGVINAVYLKTEIVGPGETTTFPGLLHYYRIHHYLVRLTRDQYHPEGYVEEQEDKTTYFMWDTCKK